MFDDSDRANEILKKHGMRANYINAHDPFILPSEIAKIIRGRKWDDLNIAIGLMFREFLNTTGPSNEPDVLVELAAVSFLVAFHCGVDRYIDYGLLLVGAAVYRSKANRTVINSLRKYLSNLSCGIQGEHEVAGIMADIAEVLLG